MIELVDVRRSYGSKVAVDGLSLSIPAGEIFAFLGPNGAGKTTTIKMMVGLLRPSSGTVRIGGIDVVENPREAARIVGYVPDEAHLYDKLSGREFLEFVGELHGLTAEQIARGIERQIVDFELDSFIDHLTESYSHGMRQRVAFAAALLHEPRALILDEPMVGLDPHNMLIVKRLLKEAARRGATVFMSTHTLPLAEEIADRIGVCLGGKMRFLGTVAQLREQHVDDAKSLEEMFLRLTREGR